MQADLIRLRATQAALQTALQCATASDSPARSSPPSAPPEPATDINEIALWIDAALQAVSREIYFAERRQPPAASSPQEPPCNELGLL